jgi:hypothetical protein
VKNGIYVFVNLACILSFFGVSACSSSQAPLPAGPCGREPERELADRIQARPEPSILFVGNSYSFGVPKAFSKLAAEQGKKVRVAHATYGGWTLRQHSENAATLRKMAVGTWDIVVFQEFSEIPAFPPWKRDAAMFPPLRALVVAARAAGAVPILYQTWGRRDGAPTRWRDDFYAMNHRVRLGYRAASANAGNLVIVPVGDAWEAEMAAGRGAMLYVADGSHPSPAGDRLTAQVFYQSIFGTTSAR